MKHFFKRIFRIFGFEIHRVYKGEDSYNSLTERTTYSDKLTLYNTSTGFYYLPTDAKNDVIAMSIIGNRIFEKEVVDIAFKYIKEDSVVLDVGANFGQMSILFSEKVGKNGKVYSFDADDFVFDILKRNIGANNKNDKIFPIFGAIHNVSDQVLFFPKQDFEEFETYGSYGIDYNIKTGREVKSIAIDDLNIQEKISFMKIDIQGGDLKAMEGAINTINKNRMPILFEYEYHFEERFNMCFQDYIDFVKKINYKFTRVINGHNFLIIPD